MSTVFDFLKNDFTNLYMKNVLEHKAVNKAIVFCDNVDLNLIYTGMFSEVNNGKGIIDDLELYLVSYLVQKHNDIKGFVRASAYVLEDQTTFIGFDIKTVDNEIWSQQNLFSVDEEHKVIFTPVQIVSADSAGSWVHGLIGDLELITVGQASVKEGQTVNPVDAEEVERLTAEEAAE